MDRKKKIAVVALALGAAALLLLRRKTAQSAEPTRAISPPSAYTGPSYSNDFGAKTFDDLLPLIRKQALDMGVDPLVLQAIMSVESNEKGWGPTGRVLLRFEPHVFFRNTGRTVLLPGMTEPVVSQTGRRRGGQADEWQAYETASKIDAEAAAQSTSWGIGQIMGFNYKALGYSSAVEMAADFDARLEAQLVGMSKFIRSNSRAYNALLRSDLPAFVDAYNGADGGTAGNNRYDSKMRDYLYNVGA